MSTSGEGEHSLVSVMNPVQGNTSEGWYWRADTDSTTLIGILNTDTQEATVAVWLDFNSNGVQTRYNLPEITIPPRAAELVDVGAIIASGLPDADGDVIPPEVTYGGYRVRKVGGRLDTTLITEALVANHRTQTYLTFYNTCCAIFGLTVIPSSITGPVGVVFPLAVVGLDSCSGLSVTLTSSASYSSATPSIASVNSLGLVALLAPGSTSVTARVNSWIDSPFCLTFATAIGPDLLPPLPCGCILLAAAVAAAILVESPPSVSISGVANVPLRAAGSTGPKSITLTASGSPSGGTFSWNTTSGKVTLSNKTSATVTVTSVAESGSTGDVPIKVTYTKNGEATATKNITVVKPTSLFLESDITNQTGNMCTVPCLDGSPGCTYDSYIRTRVYVVKDQFGRQFPNIGINTLDVRESFSGYNSGCGANPPAEGTPDTTRFGDAFTLCHTACLPGGPGCTSSATQTLTANGFPVRTVSVTWTCASASLNP